MSNTRWATKSISELGRSAGPTVQTGPFGSQLHADDYVEDGVPFILIRNIGDRGLRSDNLPRISESDAKRLARYSLKEGDIVFSRVGRIGSCLLVTVNEEGWIISGQTLRLRLQNPDIDVRFLLNYLRSHAVQNFVSLASVGTTRESLNTKILLSIPIRYPVVEGEQRRIAEILGTVDDVIEQTEALIAKQRQVRAGLMHDLFTRGLTPDGQLRPSRAEAPELYHETLLGWLPKRWSVRPLSSFTQHDITYGIVQAGPHIEGGVPYIRTGDMAGEVLVREEMLCTSRSIADSYRRSEIRKGEIVCAIRATVGKVLPVPEDLDGANLTQGTARIAPNSETDAAFLLWAIRYDRTQRSISISIKGTTFMEITLGDLRRLPVAAPLSSDERELIGLRLNEASAAISAETAYVAKLRQLKQGLMQALLIPPGRGAGARQSV